MPKVPDDVIKKFTDKLVSNIMEEKYDAVIEELEKLRREYIDTESSAEGKQQVLQDFMTKARKLKTPLMMMAAITGARTLHDGRTAAWLKDPNKAPKVPQLNFILDCGSAIWTGVGPFAKTPDPKALLGMLESGPAELGHSKKGMKM